MYGYLYCENEGLKQLLDNMKFVPNLNIIAENLSFFYFYFLFFYFFIFYVSRTLHAHAGSGVRVHAKGFLGFTFPKIDLFAH